MLLFWRKRKRGLQRRNAQEEIPSTHDGKKTLILLVVLHIYIAVCAYAFQKLEYVEAKTQRPNLKTTAMHLSRRFNISGNDSLEIIQNILGAAEKDKKVYMSSLWNEFSKAFWFVTILFTTVGTGHIVPTTFGGRLLAILTALIGIPLYTLFLKHLGECILYVNRRIINLCEMHKPRDQRGRHRNTKSVLISFFEMMFIIFMGALGAFPFDWPYFDGIYFCFISLSTVGFGDLIPDLSGDKKIYGFIYMFYNVIGLSFVSCFICAVVNAIDDFNSMQEAIKWAATSVRSTLRKSSSASPKLPTTNEEEVPDRPKRTSKVRISENGHNQSLDIPAVSLNGVTLHNNNLGFDNNEGHYELKDSLQ